MKRVFLFATLFAMLFATSCTEDSADTDVNDDGSGQTDGNNDGDDNNTSYADLVKSLSVTYSDGEATSLLISFSYDDEDRIATFEYLYSESYNALAVAPQPLTRGEIEEIAKGNYGSILKRRGDSSATRSDETLFTYTYKYDYTYEVDKVIVSVVENGVECEPVEMSRDSDGYVTDFISNGSYSYGQDDEYVTVNYQNAYEFEYNSNGYITTVDSEYNSESGSSGQNRILFNWSSDNNISSMTYGSVYDDKFFPSYGGEYTYSDYKNNQSIDLVLAFIGVTSDGYGLSSFERDIVGKPATNLIEKCVDTIYSYDSVGDMYVGGYYVYEYDYTYNGSKLTSITVDDYSGESLDSLEFDESMTIEVAYY